eukprot:CAMPEP_0114453236 /NCGR_PEP_ID=MMETSP0104-20121206/1936_1 /TAXON_ID=37642 ORGANISM="Paraphysomonas imperforata, Strain PA2" /NCGR_SAMPLE_ID=MMETSP0104 /ASSEMBLY_ACC=CAM_ASM_000202 /LENGTH=72 /DNA_ID=CAMNT_0001625531 /DNA_START=816 /DNA_END=1034 /DNA_ORIENTATION=-
MTRALQQVGIQEPQGQAAGKGLTRQRTSQQGTLGTPPPHSCQTDAGATWRTSATFPDIAYMHLPPLPSRTAL